MEALSNVVSSAAVFWGCHATLPPPPPRFLRRSGLRSGRIADPFAEPGW